MILRSPLGCAVAIVKSTCHSALERNWADEEWSNENGLHYQFPVDSEHWEARIDESLGRLLAGKRDVGRDFLDSYR